MVARADDPVDICLVIAHRAGVLAVPCDLEFAFAFCFDDWRSITILVNIADVACVCSVF